MNRMNNDNWIPERSEESVNLYTEIKRGIIIDKLHSIYTNKIYLYSYLKM